jgi:hypothetical protein
MRLPRSGVTTLKLPPPRGPMSAWVMERLRGRPAGRLSATSVEPFDDDLQLALYCCYEPHYSDLPETVRDVEWDTDLLGGRRVLETTFEAGLRDIVGAVPAGGPPSQQISAMIATDAGPSLSAHMERHGTWDEMRSLVVHRSPYQLKEADGHTFGIPRLSGRAKQLLATIQAGEYGADDHGRVAHARLFARTMRELALDDRPHAYLDALPGSALAVSNVISMFGLNRRWRGALVGHLAVVEMTSSEPSRRYSAGLRRLGFDERVTVFYDEHVEADAVHEQIASVDMCGSLVAGEPELAADVLFGAGCSLAMDAVAAHHLLGAWESGRSGLRRERPLAA